MVPTVKNYKIVIGYLELEAVVENWQLIKMRLAFNIRIVQSVFVGCL